MAQDFQDNERNSAEHSSDMLPEVIDAEVVEPEVISPSEMRGRRGGYQEEFTVQKTSFKSRLKLAFFFGFAGVACIIGGVFFLITIIGAFLGIILIFLGLFLIGLGLILPFFSGRTVVRKFNF